MSPDSSQIKDFIQFSPEGKRFVLNSYSKRLNDYISTDLFPKLVEAYRLPERMTREYCESSILAFVFSREGKLLSLASEVQDVLEAPNNEKLTAFLLAQFANFDAPALPEGTPAQLKLCFKFMYDRRVYSRRIETIFEQDEDAIRWKQIAFDGISKLSVDDDSACEEVSDILFGLSIDESGQISNPVLLKGDLTSLSTKNALAVLQSWTRKGIPPPPPSLPSQTDLVVRFNGDAFSAFELRPGVDVPSKNRARILRAYTKSYRSRSHQLEAKEYLEDAENDPTDLVKAERAASHMFFYDKAKAFALARRASQLPGGHRLYYLLLRLYRYFPSARLLSEIEQRYEEHILCNTNEFGFVDSVHATLAVFYLLIGNTEKSKASYRRIDKSFKHFAELHARMGRSLVARGDFNEAITEYTKALSIQEKSELQNDANAKLVLQLISLNRRIGQFDEANRLRSCLRKLKPEGMDIRIKRELMDELYSSDFGLLGF